MIDFPVRLDELLSKDSRLKYFVLKVATSLDPWIRDNKTVFFPEYTDHGCRHLEEVLLSADSLISDDSWEVMTPEDAAVLIVSVILHDCALHLSEDGFMHLIGSAPAAFSSKYVEKEATWAVLWAEFLAEAGRFDQKKLISLFGEAVPVGVFPKNKIDFTLKHRLLVGEFLRRHHARLAHEIAILGVPGVDARDQFFEDEFIDLLDLSGYVARSHNISLRQAVDRLLLQKRRIHLNCHAPFVMTLLRISDYIQIHSSRAPKQLLKLKGLVSPLSRGEWKKHDSIIEINQAHDDPESIYVECEPKSSAVFIEMQNLFASIQAELDQSWSVMGEVYGRFESLRGLGITVRRIRSNIDSPTDFFIASKPSYIPKKIGFRTANSELIDLLVSPLYGDRPEVGIRELIQNAVDACLERDSFLGRQGGEVISRPSSDVVVSLIVDGNRNRIVIEDHGIGMTLDVVENYFLNIGASFRYSEAWRKYYEVAGRSTIHRTGRFGIGVLAAFLLGGNVMVTTRHISKPEEEGLTFKCSQGGGDIEVKPCAFHYGTRIEVELSNSVVDFLKSNPDKWDWYCLTHPRVERYFVCNENHALEQANVVPLCNECISDSDWRRIVADMYDDVLWTYAAIDRRGWYHQRALVCNGIFVANGLGEVSLNISPGLNVIKAATPSLVVFDPDGRFPLNLQRDKVVDGNIGFEESLRYEMSVYLVERLMAELRVVNPCISADGLKTLFELRSLGEYYTGQSTVNVLCQYGFSRQGVIPFDIDLISKVGISSIVLDAVSVDCGRGAFLSDEFCKWFDLYIPVRGVTNSLSSKTNFFRDFAGDEQSYNYRLDGLSALPIVGRRMVFRKAEFETIAEGKRFPRYLIDKFSIEFDFDEWIVLSCGVVPEFELGVDLKKMTSEMFSVEAFGFVVVYLDWSKMEKEIRSPFAQAWMQYVPDVVFMT